MLSPFFQPSYSNVLNEKSNNLIPFFLRDRNLLDCCVTLQWKKNANSCCAQIHCIEFNVPRTNFSIKQPRGENELLQNRTSSTLS